MEQSRHIKILLCDKCGLHTKHVFSRYNDGYLGVPKFVDDQAGRLKVMQNVVKDGLKKHKITEHLWRCGTCDKERRYGLTGKMEDCNG